MSELIFYDLKHVASMSPSLSVQVAREMGRRIVSGAYQVGTLIDDENALAERFQVSRVVIRDAVKILVGKGLLDVRRGIGTRVRPRSQWVLLDDDVLAWHLSTPPNSEFLKQLMDMRVALEPKAARWAAERGTEEDLAVIADCVQQMRNAVSSVDRFVIADARFHQAVLKAAHNEFLSAMEGVIYSALLMSIHVSNQTPLDNESSVPFHNEVCKAIVARDADLAEQLTRTLLSDASERLDSRLG